MRIGGAYEILTPGDSRHQYSTSWRHEAAKAVKDTGDSTCQALEDDEVYLQMLYLKYIENEDISNAFTELELDQSIVTPLLLVHNANKIFSSIGTSCTSARIDALLLCPDLTYADIARAFNQDVLTVRMYEKLFFNVRDKEGKLLGSKGLIEYFANRGLPTLRDPSDFRTHWRIVAFESGHGALLNLWGWPEGDIVPTFTDFESSRSLIRLVFRNVEGALRTGRGLDSKALSSIFSDIHHKFAEYRDKGMLSSTEATSLEHLAVQLLELMQPERIQPSEEAKQGQQKVLGDRLAGLRSTSGTAEEATNLKFINSQLEK